MYRKNVPPERPKKKWHSLKKHKFGYFFGSLVLGGYNIMVVWFMTMLCNNVCMLSLHRAMPYQAKSCHHSEWYKEMKKGIVIPIHKRPVQ